jgi:hypothetical protein
MKCVKKIFGKVIKAIERSNQAKVDQYISSHYPSSTADVDRLLNKYYYGDKK